MTTTTPFALDAVATSESLAVRLVTDSDMLPEWAVAEGTMDFAYEIPEGATEPEHLGCAITYRMTHPAGQWAIKVVLHFRLRSLEGDASAALVALLTNVEPLERLCWPDLRNAARAAAATIDAPLRLGGEHPRLRPGVDLPPPELSDTADV